MCIYTRDLWNYCDCVDDRNSFVLENRNRSKIGSVPISAIVVPIHSTRKESTIAIVQLITGVNEPLTSSGSRISPKEIGEYQPIIQPNCIKLNKNWAEGRRKCLHVDPPLLTDVQFNICNWTSTLAAHGAEYLVQRFILLCGVRYRNPVILNRNAKMKINH